MTEEERNRLEFEILKLLQQYPPSESVDVYINMLPLILTSCIVPESRKNFLYNVQDYIAATIKALDEIDEAVNRANPEDIAKFN